jgi:hypothetical protein
VRVVEGSIRIPSVQVDSVGTFETTLLRWDVQHLSSIVRNSHPYALVDIGTVTAPNFGLTQYSRLSFGTVLAESDVFLDAVVYITKL